MLAKALIAVVVLAITAGGCAESKADLAAAKKFDRFPLYWAGDRFEKWNLEAIEGLDGSGEAVTFIYGDCEPKGGEQPSCIPPIEIQVFALCPHLEAVTQAPTWKTRSVRGAPVGTIDNAPVLFTSGAQVKVYRGGETDVGLPMRVLKHLRSLNSVPPVIGATGPIPAPRSGVLAGTHACQSA